MSAIALSKFPINKKAYSLFNEMLILDKLIMEDADFVDIKIQALIVSQMGEEMKQHDVSCAMECYEIFS